MSRRGEQIVCLLSRRDTRRDADWCTVTPKIKPHYCALSSSETQMSISAYDLYPFYIDGVYDLVRDGCHGILPHLPLVCLSPSSHPRLLRSPLLCSDQSNVNSEKLMGNTTVELIAIAGDQPSVNSIDALNSTSMTISMSLVPSNQGYLKARVCVTCTPFSSNVTSCSEEQVVARGVAARRAFARTCHCGTESFRTFSRVWPAYPGHYPSWEP